MRAVATPPTRPSKQERRSGEQPERETEGDADQGRCERFWPPPAKTVIKDVGQRPGYEADRRRDQGSEPALDEAAEERFLDRPVDKVEAGLKPGVARP